MTGYRAQAEQIGRFITQRLMSRIEVVDQSVARNPDFVVALAGAFSMQQIREDNDKLRRLVTYASAAGSSPTGSMDRYFLTGDAYSTRDSRQVALQELREWAQQWSQHPDYAAAVA